MTTSQTTPTLEQQLAPLATELADVQARIADLQEREKGLKAAIRDLVPGPDAYAAAGLTVSVQPNRRFDPALFATRYPVTVRPDLYKLVPDTSKVRAAVAPDEYATFMAPAGEDKVGLKL